MEKIRHWDHLLYQFRKNCGNSEIYRSFCKIRNAIQRDIRRAKAEFFSNKFDENKKQPKKLWDQLKSLGYSYKTRVQSKVALNIDDELCFDSLKVADHLNRYFTNITSDLVDRLPKGTGKLNTDSIAFKDFYKSKGVASSHFRLSPVTQDFVLNELNNLSVNTV